MRWLDLCGNLWLIWGLVWLISARRTKKTRIQESFWQRLRHLLPVCLGYILIFWSFVWFRASPNWDGIRCVGFCLCGLGLGFAIWARLHLGRFWSATITLKEDHQLIRSGPYRWFRHPIYTGMIVALLGSALAALTPFAFLGVVIAWLALHFKSRREEVLLIQNFGEAYVQFQHEIRRGC